MLELKVRSEDENRESLMYDSNLVWKYRFIIMMARYLIKKHGVQVFLGEKEAPPDLNERLLNASLDERKEIYRAIERYPDYADEKLAKIFYKESEFYPW